MNNVQVELKQIELDNQADENMCNSRLSRKKMLERRVEEFLYNYTMWKTNLNYILPNNGHEMREIVVFRKDYQMHVNVIEVALANFSALEQEFVNSRYFSKVPFKIMADQLAVGERNLYRIRKKIIRQFAIAFGWQ